MLLKTKTEREESKCKKTVSHIKFNKYELIFILDKKKTDDKVSKSIIVTVENEIINEKLFTLDDNEAICKL